jgi:hypothetical protein
VTRLGWLVCAVLAHLPALERRLTWRPLADRLAAERRVADEVEP